MNSVNHWPDSKCAKAFWGQHELPPYRRLLSETVACVAPAAGETLLDLGCGGGALTQAIWEASAGQVASVVGLDIAPANANVYQQLRESLQPTPGERIRFLAHDFSQGLGPLSDTAYDGVVSGLSISYAQSFDEETGKWTSIAYDQLLNEVFRVLKPGGRFVFSVNVPHPSWAKIAWKSLAEARRVRKPLRYLKKSWRMLRYGSWLKAEARTGRFHYLPAEIVTEKLDRAGFSAIEHRRCYAGQAFLFRCHKSNLHEVS